MCTWIAGGFGWWWLVAPVFMVLFLGLVAWAVVALVRSVSQTGGPGRQS